MNHMTQGFEATMQHQNTRKASAPMSNVVGPAAVTADREAMKVAIPFAGYRVRLFHSTLESLAEPSRFILRALSREGITVSDLLLVTGLEATQIERLLLRLQQFQLLDDDETVTDYGRRLGLALDRGLHGAEAMLWMDQLRLRSTVLLLNDTPLQTADTLSPGVPLLSGIGGRSEVLRQEQRLLNWLQQDKRQLPLQDLIETLWGDELTDLPKGPQAASQAWQLQLPADQTPISELFLEATMPLPGSEGCDWLFKANAENQQSLVLPALDWQLRYQAPPGLELEWPVPPEQRILHCLVTDYPLNASDVDDTELHEARDWPLLPLLDKLESQAHQAPTYLERSVSLQRRGRTFGINYQSVLTSARHEYTDLIYQPAA